MEFYEFCRSKDLTTVPVISVFRNGMEREVEGWLPEYREHDVYVKPVIGGGGDGVEKWNFNRGVYVRGDATFPRVEFEQFLSERSVSRALILQACLSNHPDLNFQVCNLCSIRITTSRGSNGQVECIMPVIKISRNDGEVDNFEVSGIAAEIIESTGELGRAVMRRDDVITEISCHPDTGAQITHMKVPYWEEARQLCIRAQEACEEVHFVGWDVGITPDGPVLLEGNRLFGTEGLQMICQCGMHETSFPKHFLEHYPQYS